MGSRNGIRSRFARFIVVCSTSLVALHTAGAQEPPGWTSYPPPASVWSALGPDVMALADPEVEAGASAKDGPGVGMFLLDSLVIHAVMWPASIAFSKNIRDGVKGTNWDQYKDNVTKSPNWNDGSDTITNWVSHPMLGATNFLYYRSRGHGFVASSIGVVLQSFLLEYTIEATYNRPSLHDLLMTPALGIPIGYGLDQMSLYLLKKEQKPLRYLGYLFNPFHLLPTAKKDRWQVSVDPLSRSFSFAVRY
jgi:hypothetical protein